ncbi:MAG: acetyl-CoA carboxylase biotin carboxylase subunit [Thermoleophilia bacterium]|nr:acetyl-CoA carboxylase biotin carboxylase subunit [Thermoleophilia bacterium]
MTIERVLIANRGEIAVRIIRACRDLGLESVVVCSEADVDAMPVRLADHAVVIGPPPAQKSYLLIDAILDAARESKADAIHPGYGFLAENADFAAACRQQDIVFVGPSPEAIQRMGDKISGRDIAEAAGVPVVAGVDGIDDVQAALAAAEKIGFPVMVKATGGGGGRGIRVASDPEELTSAFPQARAEAESNFANPSVYLERALPSPRHVEIQVLADNHGNSVHLFERDCSLQRRKQKLIEEAPSPALSPGMRQEMGVAALALVREADYTSAGTVEFLVEGDSFMFIEMNTRIQVEHGVTELVTGIDLVIEQLRVAMGEPLSFDQSDVELKGASIEMRICAEDPAQGFLPSPGVITELVAPAGPWVRWEAGVETGDRIQPYYDSMLGKLIVWAPDRDTAIARSLRALSELRIEGISTTVEMHSAVLSKQAFRSGEFDVQSIDAWIEDGSLLSK